LVPLSRSLDTRKRIERDKNDECKCFAKGEVRVESTIEARREELQNGVTEKRGEQVFAADRFFPCERHTSFPTSRWKESGAEMVRRESREGLGKPGSEELSSKRKSWEEAGGERGRDRKKEYKSREGGMQERARRVSKRWKKGNT
jgi:hypothetical protein